MKTVLAKVLNMVGLGLLLVATGLQKVVVALQAVAAKLVLAP